MRFLSVAAVLAFSLTCFGETLPKQVGKVNGMPVYEMAVERLPDLNVPRAGHVAVCAGGELTVIGGHTTGFVPTPTAEYYRDGRWQLVESIFPHDFGFSVILPSQEVLVGGGCAEPFGIGQTFGVERYDPVSHTFSPLPILDRRRARASAARLSDGTVVVAGNWYADDAISTYSSDRGGTILHAASQNRSCPLIFQTAPDNALILSAYGVRADTLEAVADRLRGGPLEVPLLREWSEWCRVDSQQMSMFFIGDETVGGYAWLFPAIRKEDGQLGLIKVVGEEFSVLETECPIPMLGLDGETLQSNAYLITDQAKACAWLVRIVPGTSRVYVFSVGYGEALRGGKAPVKMYVADLLDGALVPEEQSLALLSGDRIALVGGRLGADNYNPAAAAFILHTEPLPRKAFPWWIVIVGALLAGAGVLAVRRRCHPEPAEGSLDSARDDNKSSFAGPSSSFAGLTGESPTLLSRILDLMEKDELWRQKGLKVSDLATRLGTNATYISACINGQAGKSFPEFLNDYRLRHAQKLMTEQPDKLLSEVAEESGYSNEQSFFRSFKARTGLTPQEWKASR